MSYKNVTAIILAAGKSTRMNSQTSKNLLTVGWDTVIRHTVRAFERAESIRWIVVVCSEDQLDEMTRQCDGFSKVCRIVVGGESRTESARRGFEAIPKESDLVAIHDGARCLIAPEIINLVVGEAEIYGAATAGTVAVDTVKYTEDGMSQRSVPRESLFLAHTPQVFYRDLYAEALSATHDLSAFTDDNSLVENIGKRVKCVDTGRLNIKLTTPEDLLFAEFILNKRGGK